MQASSTSAGAGRARARWPRRLLLCVLAAALGLGALELAARVLVDPPAVNARLVADGELGYRLPADVTLRNFDRLGAFDYVLNSEGFRGPELPAGDALPDGPRILLVGDSFLNAWGVREEELVGSALAPELARAGVASHVYTLCCDDYGTAQELLLVRRYAERLRPDTIVLFLYPGNDTVNNTLALAGRTPISPGDYFRPYLVPDETGETGALELRHALPGRALLRRSRLFTWAEALWLRRQTADDLRAELVAASAYRPPPDARPPLPNEHLEIFRAPLPGDAWDQAWRATEALVLAQRDEARSRGARFFVVVVPYLLQVERSPASLRDDAVLRKQGRPSMAELLDWNLPETHLEGFFHANAIEHLQLLELLRAEARRTARSPYLRDFHLNGPAHLLMARLLAERLQQGGSTCFAPAEGTPEARPVEMDEFFPESPLHADFGVESRRELMDGGWLRWRGESPDGGSGGWELDCVGGLALPAWRGPVTLRGRLTEAGPFPIEVGVRFQNSDSVLLHQTCAGPGEFTLELPEAKRVKSEVPWLLLQVELGTPAAPIPADQRVRLVLTAIEAGS